MDISLASLSPFPSYFNTEIEDIRNQTLSLFKEFIEGDSVRTIAKRNNIPFETLRDRFHKFVGFDYRFYSGSEGSLVNILHEYKSILSPSEYAKILLWYDKNKIDILKKNYDMRKDKIRLYSDRGIYNIESNQSYYKEDLRDSFFLI
jgi:hypothetical protein